MPKSNSLFLSLLFVFVFSLPTRLSSQDFQPGDNHIFTILTFPDSSTQEGYVKNSLSSTFYNRIIFFSKTGEKKVYTPYDDLLMFHLVERKRKFYSARGKFLEILFDGMKTTLLTYAESKVVPITMHYGSTVPVPIKKRHYLLKRAGSLHIQKVKSQKFKKVYSDFFEDCPSVVNKIKSKKYKKNDIEDIVWEYESCSTD
ncbi:MAG: hypothetical protein AAF388_19685 [Bacteroidota bacterium]